MNVATCGLDLQMWSERSDLKYILNVGAFTPVLELITQDAC